jgi:hypothetical protein
MNSKLWFFKHGFHRKIALVVDTITVQFCVSYLPTVVLGLEIFFKKMAKNETIEERKVFWILELRIFEILFSPHCLLHSASKILDIRV